MPERQARIAVIVGGGLIAAGAFMPWVTLGILSVSGVQGDGVFAILIGVATVAVMAAAYIDGPSATQRALVLVLGVAGLGLYGLEYRNVTSLATGQPGSGLILGAVGALAVLLFSNAIGKRVSPPAA